MSHLSAFKVRQFKNGRDHNKWAYLLFCIFCLGLPSAVKNCTYSNQTQISVEIHCIAGYDGGLPQYFVLELVSAQTGRVRYVYCVGSIYTVKSMFDSSFFIFYVKKKTKKKLQIQPHEFRRAIFLGRVIGSITFD